MCLSINYIITKERQKKPKDSVIVAYKYLSVRVTAMRKKFLYSFHYPGKSWTAGERSSNRKTNQLTQKEVLMGMVTKGIHVFTRRPKLNIPYGTVVIAVRCKMEDFIAASYDEMVFSKVSVSEHAYKSAIKTATKQQQ